MKIEVKNVSKSFKKVPVLENININFEPGNIYALVGRNGSGKSVFLKLLCGFYKPDAGEILIDGIDIIKNGDFPPSTRALIDSPSFLPELSGLENLSLLAKVQSNLTKEDIEKTLEMVNLTEEMNKNYIFYSYGMKQKLGIAQVLMENPDLMIFDEPFNGIEEKTVIKLREIFLKLKEENKIIIISTHIKDDVKLLADYIYQFDDKRITLIENVE
ncbi:MAG: ATP-binding cassette domain-containing protein [Bacilli bacterium]|nr:ATP-binding cassette domain-containing protein [Bacilli bacterium]MDD4547440.1 ATP-binding cassette domain-containing protein [Bacilli bacterium]